MTWRNWKPCALLVVMANGAVGVEKSGRQECWGLGGAEPISWSLGTILKGRGVLSSSSGGLVHVDCKGSAGGETGLVPTVPEAFLPSIPSHGAFSPSSGSQGLPVLQSRLARLGLPQNVPM